MRRRLLLCGLATLAAAASCGRGGAPADSAARDSASRAATPSAAALPPSAIPTTVHLLADFDDEGVIERPPPLDSAPGPYRMGDDLYADAAGVAAAFEPGVSVSVADGRLVLRGQPTAIPVRMHGAGGTVPYAPVRAIARAFDGFLYENRDGRAATLWPAARLCEYRRRFGRPGARVYDGAQAEGLFAQCAAR
ncbi:MAG TPA: hypothetical protein VKA84_25370 [Gemmatimonadaceae bacterium]|nr:hypothetical protein [Gemmatimonadaceae bacterium]